MPPQIQIISINKLNKDYHLIAENYQKIIKYCLKITEITYSKKLPITQIKQFEAKLYPLYK